MAAEAVKRIILEELGVPEKDIVPGARLCEDLGAGSLDIIELAMAMEEEGGFDIADEEIEKWDTVGDVIRTAEEKGRE